METYRQKWDKELLEVLCGSVGERISEVRVREMALYGLDEAPSFTHSQLKFVQAHLLDLRLESGAALQFGVLQDDDEFAIWPKRLVCKEGRLQPIENVPNASFRTRLMPEFPLGQIMAVAPEVDERGNIQKVTLSVSAQEVILKAAEVYEDLGGNLTIIERDESILVFIDSAAYHETVFGEAAYSAR